MLEIEPISIQALFLFLAGCCAGFIDSIAGGGGLVSFPALLAAGIPPTHALGTNKLQSSIGTFSATLNYIKKGKVKLSEMPLGIFWTFIGASTGTLLVQRIDPAILYEFIPYMLVGVALFFVLQPKLGQCKKKPRLGRKSYYCIFGLVIGFYDGFFGPGTGSFWMFTFVTLLGLNLVEAAARSRIVNFTSNIAALILFASAGQVLWQVGLMMAAGQIIGARLGSSLAIEWGPRLIRPILVLVSLAISVNLLVHH